MAKRQYRNHIEEMLEERVFPVYTAEFYEPNISPYFMTPQQEEAPVVDGIPLTHEEYKELHPDYEIPPQWTPKPIYQTFDLNMSRSFRSTRELIEMYAAGVPFRFENRDDMMETLSIADSFLVILQSYQRVTNVEDFIEATSNYIHIIKSTRDTLIKNDLANKGPKKTQMTISDWMAFL